MPEHSGLTTARSSKVCAEGRTNISVDLNVPGAVSSNHVEYGASVFAAGRIGLELVRSALARAGIARDELKKLDTTHVSIHKATIPYVFNFASRTDTAAFTAALNHLALLLGLGIKHYPASNIVEYRGLPAKGSAATTVSNECRPTDKQYEVTLSLLRQPDNKLVLIEVTLTAEYLKDRDWIALDSWRNAYAENRYALIFDETVRALFGLDAPVHYNEPSRNVLDGMTQIQADVLRHYLDGKDPSSYGRFVMALGKGKKSRMVNDYRKVILGHTGIDIKIPWQTFKALRPSRLCNQLKYPGDFQPPDEQAHLYFCKASWHAHLAKLRQDFNSAPAVAAGPSKSSVSR